MQVRHLNPNEEYFLHILKNNREIPSFLQRHSLDQKNGVLLYPDPNDNSRSSTGARTYKACFMINNQLILDGEKLKEVSMGKFITRRNHAAITTHLPSIGFGGS